MGGWGRVYEKWSQIPFSENHWIFLTSLGYFHDKTLSFIIYDIYYMSRHIMIKRGSRKVINWRISMVLLCNTTCIVVWYGYSFEDTYLYICHCYKFQVVYFIHLKFIYYEICNVVENNFCGYYSNNITTNIK